MASFGKEQSHSTDSTTSAASTALQRGDKNVLSGFLYPQIQDFGAYLQQQLETPFQLPTLNRAGMFDTQNTAIDQLLRNATSTASSGLAQRGFLNANATPLTAQMGVQSFLPQYLAQVGANVEQQATIPEQVRSQRLGDVQNAFQQLIALLGGQSSTVSNGSSRSSGGSGGLSTAILQL